MTRNEQWHATHDLLEENGVTSNASCMDELTEYLHQIGLGGERETFGQMLEAFGAYSPRSTKEEIITELERIYKEGSPGEIIRVGKEKKMNLKLRVKNKAVLLALIAAAVTFIYQVFGLLGIAPPISEEQVLQIVGILLNLLVGLGILVDPTTAGISDSARAREYEAPNKDKGQDEEQGYLEDGNNGDITESENQEKIL